MVVESVFEPTGRANARPMTGSVGTGSREENASKKDESPVPIPSERGSSGFWEDEVVPLICPTCQVFDPNGRLRRPPATVHGVVFDIFSGSRDQTFRAVEWSLAL